MKDDNFHVELLECAKLLNLPNDDYTQKLIEQIPLDYFYVPQDEKESILLLFSESEKSIKHQLLGKLCLNDLDATTVFAEVLNDLKIQDLNLCCDIYEDVATREPYFMEEPLLPSRIQKNNEFDLYPIPTLKQLSNKLPTTDIFSEPFVESEMQQFTFDDLCLPHNEEVVDNIASIMSFLKENDVRNDNDFVISIKEFKFEDYYIEEPLISIKSDKSAQDLPNKIIEIVPLIIDDIDINVQNDRLVPEETGVKAPLEMLNEWEGIDKSTFDVERTSDYNYVEVDVSFDPFLTSRETLQLEPAMIPARYDPLEVNRRKRRKTDFGSEIENADDKDVTITNSLAQTIKSVVSEDATFMHQKLDDQTALQSDLEKMLKVENPDENWKSVIMWQSMNELEGLKFKVPQLPHPVSQITRGSINDEDGVSFPSIPTQISDLIAHPNSMHSDFQILTSFSGMKALEFELHWNPIKNTSHIDFEQIFNVKLSSQEILDVFKELCSCANDDDILDTIDMQFINKIHDSYLITRKKMYESCHESKKLEVEDVPALITPKWINNDNDFKDIQKSSTEPNIVKSRYFADTFSATRSIDDFLILRGKIAPNKRRDIDLKKKGHVAVKNGEESKQIVPSVSNTPDDHAYGYTRYTHRVPSSESQLTDSDKDIQDAQNAHVMARTIIDNMPMPVVTHKYIVSARLLANRGLLSALKGIYCKVEIFERDFEYLRPLLPDDESETLYIDCDLIIDERTGIIYYPLNLISQEQSVPIIARTIIRLAQKYSSLYVILETYTWNNKATNDSDAECILPYSYTLPVLKAVAGLQAILTRYSCDAHIIFSSCEEMSARLARLIGDLCASKCEEERGKDRQQWESRDWMTMEESLHERFLSCFSPLINPFTAQIILTAIPMPEFLRMTHSERYAMFGRWIDEWRLEKFETIIHTALSGNPEQLFTNDEPEVHIDDNQMEAEWINEFKDFELEEFYD
ncbi:13044_t:CDS:10 [Cetraspora pellucida]|uniref:13044_t:CDS:1 n=1 Tax=Cetraspora pellucida TaxID=1433469 RepID=A0ACA9KI92_9GLOM|nr:13044_t:CDS:10 [Cetraspora pellucida]